MPDPRQVLNHFPSLTRPAQANQRMADLQAALQNVVCLRARCFPGHFRNPQRARSLRVFTTEATIKIKHFSREELILMEKFKVPALH